MKLYARLAAAAAFCLSLAAPASAADKLQDVLGAGKLRVGVLMDAAPWASRTPRAKRPAWTSIWPG